MEKSLEFYNKFDKKLIKDFVGGNKRIVSAIKNLGKRIPIRSKSILDIGCGIGWSTYEFSKAFKQTQVDGVDLSPVLIDTANKIFSNPNLSYSKTDLTLELPKKGYDVVVMIDVYEHIPKSDRNKFHSILKGVLNAQGRLLLACPSKYHQDYLRKYHPEGLQPVDEDVDLYDIMEIAKALQGEVIYFEYQTVWNSNDYFHAIIEIKPKHEKDFYTFITKGLELEKRNNRIKLIEGAFGSTMGFTIRKKYLIRSILNKIKKKLITT